MKEFKKSSSFTRSASTENKTKFKLEFESRYWGQAPVHLTLADGEEFLESPKLTFTSDDLKRSRALRSVFKNTTSATLTLPDRFLNHLVNDECFLIQDGKLFYNRNELVTFTEIMKAVIPALHRVYKGTHCSYDNYKNPYETQKMLYIFYKGEVHCTGQGKDFFNLEEELIPIHDRTKVLYNFVDRPENSFYIEETDDGCWINPCGSSREAFCEKLTNISDTSLRSKVAHEALDIIMLNGVKYMSVEELQRQVLALLQES